MPGEVYTPQERQPTVSTPEMAERMISRNFTHPGAIQEDPELLEGSEILYLVDSRVIHDPHETFLRLLPEIKSQIENGPYAQYYEVIYVDAVFLKPGSLEKKQEITNLLPKAILKAAGEDVEASDELPIDLLDDYIASKAQEKKCVVILVDHVDSFLDQFDDWYHQGLATTCFKHLYSRPPYIVKMAKRPSSYAGEVLADFNEMSVRSFSEIL